MESTSDSVADSNGQPNLIPVGLSKEQIDIMWQMGAASFRSNNNELVIPNFMAIKLNEENIADLRSRFSAHFGNAPATAYIDHSAQVFRIRKALELPATGNGLAGMSSPLSRSTSPQSMMSTLSPAQAPKRARSAKGSLVKPIRLPGKKSKVPRPPNAFILYRAKNHPILKEEKPTLSNNDISIILGKKWRDESEEVRAHFKDLADNIKARHAAENPGYQYAPRKASEKKRRMTARKLAALRNARAKSDSPSGSDLEMTDVAEIDGDGHHDNMAVDSTAGEVNKVVQFYQDDGITSTTNVLDSERGSYPSRVRHGNSGTMSVILPAGHDEVERDYHEKMSRYVWHVDPADEMDANPEVFTRPTWSSLSADDFMNSLVDWEAIRADAKIVHKTARQPGKKLETLHFDSVAEQTKFQQELDRILWMLE